MSASPFGALLAACDGHAPDRRQGHGHFRADWLCRRRPLRACIRQSLVPPCMGLSRSRHVRTCRPLRPSRAQLPGPRRHRRTGCGGGRFGTPCSKRSPSAARCRRTGEGRNCTRPGSLTCSRLNARARCGALSAEYSRPTGGPGRPQASIEGERLLGLPQWAARWRDVDGLLPGSRRGLGRHRPGSGSRSAPEVGATTPHGASR
jgi:hypothetical protein